MNANSILKTQIAALKDEKRKEENKEFTITINVKKHDDNETDINVYKTEIDKLTREVDHLRKENDKIYSILNDAVKVVRNRNKQQ
jgi:predicted RNase H-like nuclease (RuvC/YqgF family)